jgi:hypothetical protein
MKSDLSSRKYRWTFSIEFPGHSVVDRHVKINARPSLHIVEKENIDGSFRIEKQAWAPFTTTFYTVDGDLQNLFQVLASFYDFGADLFKNADPSEELDKIASKLGIGTLKMFGPTGDLLDEWSLSGLWPHSVNFGDLCYSSSADIEVEVTWRFKKCIPTQSLASV